MSHQADTASPLVGEIPLQSDGGAASSGHLLEFGWVDGSWQVFDRSSELGGVAIAGTPALYGGDGGGEGGGLRVFAAGADGHLLEFGWVDGSWQVFDRSSGLGGVAIAGTPALYGGGDGGGEGGGLRVFAAGADGHLLEFGWVDGSWQVFDRSSELGGVAIAGTPALYGGDGGGEGGGLRVFAAGADGHLLEFGWVDGSWQVFDRSSGLGGVAIAGTPALYGGGDGGGEGGGLRVFAAGADGHLLEFGWVDGSWQVFDRSSELGGVAIAGTPALYGGGDGGGEGGGLRVFAAGADGHLLEFGWVDGSWQVFDRSSELGGVAIAGTPALYGGGDGGGEGGGLRVFAAGADGHLLEFGWVDGSWQVFDRSSELGGVAIAGTPALYGDGDALRVFATSSQPSPVVVTGAASAITPRSATLVGSVDPQGAATVFHFEYGVSDEYGSVVPAVDGDVGLELAQVDCDVSDLQPGTTYHFRLVATNTGGRSYGPDLALTTLPQPAPDVSTGAASDIGDTTAILTGTVNPEGSPTSCHFQFGPTADYGSDAPKHDLGAESTPQQVARPIVGLAPDATYHYRLVATNAAGSGYGDDSVFATTSFTSVTHRVARVTVVNANSDDHTLSLWQRDETEPSRSWEKIGDVQIDGRQDFIPTDRHTYQLVAVDPARCGQDDPQAHKCRRWDARVIGDRNGQVHTYVL